MSEVITVRREDLEVTPDYIYLTVLLSSLFYQKGLDMLEGTPYYKQRLKNTSKMVHEELRLLIASDLVPVCANNQHERMYFLSQEIDELLHETIITRLDYIPVIVTMIKKFKQDPQRVMDFFELYLTDDLQ